MNWLARRGRDLRWLAVPLGAYLLITVIVPLLNGAGGRSDFAVHLLRVLGGCAAVSALALFVTGLRDLAGAARRLGRRRTCNPRLKGTLS